jgi:hypothetical protein
MYRHPNGSKRDKTNLEGTDMRTELVIDDEDARILAAELVELTGESLRSALVTALREQIVREMARKARQERIMAITRDIARGSRMAA